MWNLMLQAIVAWSLRNRVIVVVLAALLVVVGAYAATHAKLDVFPEFAPPQVVVQTECPGLSPSEVEQLVTGPIETAVNGISGLDMLRSQSIQGLSVVTIIFHGGTDIYRARQQVTERLGELAGQLPSGVKSPRLEPLTSTTGRLLTVGFTSDKLSPRELRDRVQWNIRPRILGIRGVASVTLFGGEVRQYQVQVDPDYLAARNLTLTQVLDTARQASSIRGAGFLENRHQRVNLRTEGQVLSAADLGETTIATVDGTPVRLKDIGHVTEAPEPKFGDGAINGKPGVILIVSRQLQGDTPDVTRRVEEELKKLEPSLRQQGIIYHPALFRQANFIEHAIGNVTNSLLIGAILVALVLFVFLYNVRTAFISLTAIPLSLLSAIAILWAMDISLNTLTLGGLAIAVGEVVDDAIIDVENIFRRLRENARLGQPRSEFQVILSASLEVRSAVVYATFVVVLVFVPIFFLSGLQGRLFAPLGYAYVLAVLASLVVALTVTPALAYLLLPQAGGAEEPPLLRRLQGGYEWLLRRLDRDWLLVLTVTVILLATGVYAVTGFGGRFLPELRENHYTVHMRGLPGTSLEQSMATGKRVSEKILKIPGVVSAAQQAGRAELGEDTWGVEYNEIEVDLQRLDAEEAQKVEHALKHLEQDFAGWSFEPMPFLTERINETMSGTSAAVAIKIFGDDFAKLDATAIAIARILNKVPGHENVRIEPQTGAPELVVRPRNQDLGRFNLRKAQILDVVHAAYAGADVGQVYDRNRILDMSVILAPAYRLDADGVANLWLSTGPDARAPDSPPGRVQLKQVADVYLYDGRFLISHESGIRRQVVSCNVKGRDVESFVAEAEKRIRELVPPEGVFVDVTGEHQAKQAAQRELLLLSLGAGAGILLLLWLAFGSLGRLALVLVNLPFALVGGALAVYLGGGILDVGSLIGFVTLFGITTRNSIMMVSHWQHLHEAEGMPLGPDLIFRGARERLAPVLMTALVTGLGLLPIAVGSGEAGREIEGPMAQVILGGLVTSTALNLLVLPVLYRRVGLRPEPAATPA
jgi:CzcA family heavy metal efflux pump